MKTIVEYFSDEKISLISEYLLSKKHNKTKMMHDLDKLNDIMQNYLYVETFKGANTIINNYYKNENFNFIVSFILKLMNEYDFLLAYRYDSSKQIFYTANDIDKYLGDETTKVIRLFKFGYDGIALEIINVVTLVCCSIIIQNNNFKVYTVKLKDIGDMLALYDNGDFSWEEELITKVINSKDINTMNEKIIPKII